MNELKSIVARTLSITENALSVTLVRNAAGQRDFEMLITEPYFYYYYLKKFYFSDNYFQF